MDSLFANFVSSCTQLMINKHENISVGVCWDDVGVPA
jgi:hypothetical protein